MLRPARQQTFEDSPEDVFGYECSQCACTVTVRGLDGNFEPTLGLKTRHGAHKVPQKAITKLFFRSPTRHFWVLSPRHLFYTETILFILV